MQSRVATKSRTAPVSVVVPTFNGQTHVAETLQSVMAQSRPPLEIIVVDDGSTDGTLEAVNAACPSAVVIKQANAGVSSARNSGLRAARGEFVCFLDQDDVWFDDHLDRQLRCLEAFPEADVVVSPYYHWYPRAGKHPSQAEVRPPTPATSVDPDFSGWVYHHFLLDCWALTSATTLRRRAVVEVGGFDERLPFSEDWDLWLRLSRQVQFVKITDPPVLYRQHPVQGSRKARPIDHRCELLLAAASAHGLASRDGRAIDPQVFMKTIAQYQADFGYHQLQYGERSLGVKSLWQAWRRRPGAGRTLVYALGASLGWRPRRTDIVDRAPAK